MFKRIDYSCHVKSSHQFCLVIALLFATLFDMVLLSGLLDAAGIKNDDRVIHVWVFLTLFIITYGVIYLSYGYRIWIETDRPHATNATLWVRGTHGTAATAIPTDSIDKVISSAYRDLPEDMYAMRQHGHSGEGIIVYYTLTAMHGDGSGQQRRIWFPLCDKEKLKNWFDIL
ncbi:MAG: hypothetical protein ABW104_11840 [Candidatus Thiodiazotropha sp. 6PLUC2]